MVDRFKYPVDDTTEEVEDNMDYFQDDAWLEFDEIDEGYDDEEVAGFIEDLERRIQDDETE